MMLAFMLDYNPNLVQPISINASWPIHIFAIIVTFTEFSLWFTHMTW